MRNNETSRGIVEAARKCELLAPAGGMIQLKAALCNGADAVYLGGPFLNARMNAEGFTMETLKEAADLCHVNGARMHVTLNTLIKDEELPEALEYASRLYEIGADAFIIQDLGLAASIHEILPDMPLHLSTQGTICDPGGARFAKNMGFTRVVPARETELSVLRQIADTGIEVEVFVHGALCFCYSGQCQLSRIIGGRSGNRGECAQPCRLEYDLNSRKQHALSPKDLCMIDHLGELIEAGACSFKIEGRMKSPEYVAVVTSIYRKYLDLYCEDGEYSVSHEDRQKLLQIYNRGGFTEGYIYGDPGASLMSGSIPKHQGIHIGTVAGKKPKDSTLVDIIPDRRLSGAGSMTGAGVDQSPERRITEEGAKAHPADDQTALPLLQIGDGIEIQSDPPTGNIVTYIKPAGGSRLRVGDIRGRVRAGDDVYRLSSKRLMDEARASYEHLSAERNGSSSAKPHQNSRGKIKADMRFEGRIGSPLRLEMRTAASADSIGKHPSRPVITAWASDPGIIGEKALKRAVTEDQIRKQLSKLGETIFTAGDISIYMDEDLACSYSDLNKLRRMAAADLEGKYIESFRREIPETDIKEVKCSKEQSRLSDACSDNSSSTEQYVPSERTERSESRLPVRGICLLGARGRMHEDAGPELGSGARQYVREESETKYEPGARQHAYEDSGSESGSGARQYAYEDARPGLRSGARRYLREGSGSGLLPWSISSVEKAAEEVADICSGKHYDFRIMLPLDIWMDNREDAEAIVRAASKKTGVEWRPLPYTDPVCTELLQLSEKRAADEDRMHAMGTEHGCEQEAYLEQAAAACRDTGLAAGNVSWIELMKNRGIDLFGTHGLNVYNERTRRFLQRQGLIYAADSAETWEKEQNSLPVMITRHKMETGRMKDRKNASYIIADGTGNRGSVILSDLQDREKRKKAWSGSLSSELDFVYVFLPPEVKKEKKVSAAGKRKTGSEASKIKGLKGRKKRSKKRSK